MYRDVGLELLQALGELVEHCFFVPGKLKFLNIVYMYVFSFVHVYVVKVLSYLFIVIGYLVHIKLA